MTITSFDALREWFFNNQSNNITQKAAAEQQSDDQQPSGKRKGGSEWQTMPFWTVRSRQFGSRDNVIAFNDREANAEKAFAWLCQTIRNANNPVGSTFHVLQSATAARNMGCEVDVQIFGEGAAPAGAAIGALPMGAISGDEFDRRLKQEREMWDLQQQVRDLEYERKNADWIGRLPEILSQIFSTPLGSIAAAKLMGVPVSHPSAQASAPAPVAGMPRPTNPDDDDDAPDEFEKDLSAVCDTLGTDEETLMRKLRLLVEKNPEMAKTLIQ